VNGFRFGVRQLARNPGYSLVVAALLALSIGASTAVFSIVDAVLLRDLPVAHPRQLVRMVQRLPRLGTRSNFPYSYYQALKQHSPMVADVFAETEIDSLFPLSDPLPVEEIRVSAVTPEFFNALGIHASYGRLFTVDEARSVSHTPPAVLSYRFWRRHFHGDLRAIGQTIVLNRKHFVVVGIMPRDFNGIALDTSPDVRIPVSALPVLWDQPTDRMQFEIAGRLRPGVSRTRAAEECRAIWKPVMTDYYSHIYKYPPQVVSALLDRGMSLEPLARGTSILRDRFGEAFQLLAASIGFVLLIVCTNLAGLLLARVAAHQEQYAVRLALGASRFRLMRQMLSENLLLTVAGAVGGFLIAIATIPAAVRLIPPVRDLTGTLVPLSVRVGMDGRAFAFLLLVSLLVMLLFSVTPAITAARLRVDTVLRSARFSIGWRGRRILITVQVALCTFLLLEAGLLVRTFHKLRDVQPGFDADQVVTFYADLGDASTNSALARGLLERVRELPGVASAAISSVGVMREHGLSATAAPAGQQITQANFMNSNVNAVSPDYLKTMGIRLLAGRAFLPTDAVAVEAVGIRHVIVSQTFAKTVFPGMNAVGKRFGLGMVGQTAKADFEIIGVVSDTKYRTLREPVKPMFYRPDPDFDNFILNVRTLGKPESVIQQVTKVLASVDPNSSFLEVRTLTEEMDQTTAGEQASATLSSMFGGIAIVLVAIGIYGLLSYMVAQRRREIGIRIALGGQPKHVARLIVREALGMVGSGIAIGIGAAFVAGPVIRSQLYGVSPQDPMSVAIAAVFVVAIALAAAAMMPAWRAIRTNPSVVLRELG
jgi:predicted permease